VATSLASPPLQTELIESARNPLITKVWAAWLRSLVDRAQVAAFSIITVSLTLQGASIGLTSLVPLASGLYRVSYRFRITTAAGVSSSLQFAVSTTDGAVVCTQSSAAYTGNVTNAPQAGVFIVRADPATPLQYQTTYASNAAGVMKYSLDVTVEQL
jgi:hypothetical protein